MVIRVIGQVTRIQTPQNTAFWEAIPSVCRLAIRAEPYYGD
jgi:hypothetical protein